MPEEPAAEAAIVSASMAGLALAIATVFNLLHQKQILGDGEADAALLALGKETQFKNPLGLGDDWGRT